MYFGISLQFLISCPPLSYPYTCCPTSFWDTSNSTEDVKQRKGPPKRHKICHRNENTKIYTNLLQNFLFFSFFLFPSSYPTPSYFLSFATPLCLSLFSNCCIYLLKPTHTHGCAYQQEGSEPSSHSGRFCRHPGLWRHGPAGPEGRGPSRSPSSCQRGPEPVLQHDANRTQEIISTRS